MRMLADGRGNADAAGLGQRFQPGGNIDTIPRDIITVYDDVAQVDANPEIDAVVRREVEIARAHLALRFDRTTQCCRCADELDQHSVASGMDDPTAVECDT